MLTFPQVHPVGLIFYKISQYLKSFVFVCNIQVISENDLSRFVFVPTHADSLHSLGLSLIDAAFSSCAARCMNTGKRRVLGFEMKRFAV